MASGLPQRGMTSREYVHPVVRMSAQERTYEEPGEDAPFFLPNSTSQ